MQNYLVISNKGLIEKEDLFLIGSSTKRGDSDKIGMFGSGWKYALAWMIRNECNPIIFSGTNQIKIDHSVVLHRNAPVKVITVDNEKTSITTSMGPKWTGWMALREIVSNAIDEGEFNLTTILNPETIENSDDSKTVIYIPINSDIQKVLTNFENYFSFDKKDNGSNMYGRIFVKNEQSSINIYRKGIRCYDTTRQSMVDFDFNDIDINESRLTSESSLDRLGVKFINEGGFSSTTMIAILMSNYRDFIPNNTPNRFVVEMLLEINNRGYNFHSQSVVRFQGESGIEENSLQVPDEWFKWLVNEGICESPFTKMFNNLGSPADYIETNKINEFEIKQELIKIKMDSIIIKSGTWRSQNCVVFYEEGVFYVNDKILNESNSYIAAEIMSRMPARVFLRILDTL